MSNIEGFNVESDQWIVKKLYSLIESDEEARKSGEPATRPYVLEGQPEDEKVTIFSTEKTYREAIDAAIKYAYDQSSKQTRIILFFDGYVRLKGVRRDAFLYQVYSKDGTWLQFAQAYQPKGLFRQYKRKGDLVFVREVETPGR
ncbi:hypothetical protein [Desulfitobacterium chlororespirans]|uniref:Uncharacterized protein n=1 Tax=Desulfitobacterium chlororespirans DSM 11544 TaxID=1121395 RepID=A0A1M7USB5_9FIRM|nr:hypothetical protein [Desulfitobacterium chlororespirans]SHN85923.1 hypothetical protein SAMN02745215_04532 [Desulfitobacterium chlororespirans DSM 11544]